MVVGATGFLGRAVHAEVSLRCPDAVGLCRHPGEAASRTMIRADITAPESLSTVFAGADAVVHVAPYVGPDPAVSELVNVGGTENVVLACERARVERLVYVSTTSVYGLGPHRGLRVQDAVARPASPRSGHRLLAEQMVVGAGGCVLRPNVVFGVGDRWAVPALIRLVGMVGGLVDGGRARQSVISVDDLALVIARICTRSVWPLAGRVPHAVQPTPVTVLEIAETARAHRIHSASLEAVDPGAAREAALRAGFSEHQFDLATVDHWYDGDEVWDLTGMPDRRGIDLSAAHVAWYRSLTSASLPG